MSESLRSQVETIREAFGYSNRFKGQTFVIKLDGALIQNQALPSLVRDIVLLQRMGIRIVLVPGAREHIDTVLKQFNVKCRWVNGTRITTAKAMPFVKMAAFDVSNRVMTMLSENGADAVIGNWVKARSIGIRDGINYHNTGLVEKVKADIVSRALADNLITIFPTIGWNAKGTPYNISSNELAATIAGELAASKLFYCTVQGGIKAQGMTISPGSLVSPEGTISIVTVNEADTLVEENKGTKATAGLELVDLGVGACRQGVNRVHILDGTIDGVLLTEIFSNRGSGTMIYANQYENVRAMTWADIPDVLNLMQPLVDKSQLIARTADDLEARLDDYVVYEIDTMVHGCGALHLLNETTGEIAAIGVDENCAGMGIGRKMVRYLLDKAARAQLRKILILTTQAADWFFEIGFEKGRISDLPQAKRSVYNRSRNSSILVYHVV